MTYRLRSILALALAFAVPFSIYSATLDAGVDFWDTGELQTVPYILGIAHPSGFPAYVLIGWLWSHAIPFADPAWRLNLLSAAGMSLTAVAIVALLVELEVEPVFALGAALVFAFAHIPWDHATHADVHALAIAVSMLTFWLALRWVRTGAPWTLPAAGAGAGLALGIHSGMILVLPGAVLAAAGRRPALRVAALAAAAGIVVVAAAYAYLPLRSAAVYAQRKDPTLQIGLPPGRPFWDNDHPSTWTGFRSEVGGGAFGARAALARLADPHTFARVPKQYGRQTIGDLAAGVFVIAAAGAFALVRRRPLAGIGMLLAGFVPVLFVLAYPAESDPDRYFLPSYVAIATLLGIGAQTLARGGMARPPAGVVALIGVLFAFVAGSNVYANRDAFLPRAYEPAQDFIDTIVRTTAPNAIIVAPWYYATALAYGAYVEQRLGRRIVVTGWWRDYRAAQYRAWAAARPLVIVTDEPTLTIDGLLLHERTFGPAPHVFYGENVR